MELTIEQNCPSCGASIVLREDDRLIRCLYCDISNYRLGSAAGRYILPGRFPGDLAEDDIFFMPYLRFKGSIFYVQGAKVKHKIVDTSRLGIESDSLPVSLGLRPQAMRLAPVVSAVAGKFIRQTVPTKSVFAQAAMVTELFGGKSAAIHHRAFIGETISLIYQPCFRDRGMIVDAVDRQPLGDDSHVADHLANACRSQAGWEPRFISTLCPGCGGALAGEQDSWVLHCPNCESFWQEIDGRFQSLTWHSIATDRKARLLPFWKITFAATGGERLCSFGDYLRFANSPMVFGRRFDATPLSFVIPAFKVNPRAFLQVASQLTLGQWKLPEGGRHPLRSMYPVTLGQQEAIEAIKSVLAATSARKKERLPMLSEIKIEVQQSSLLFVPFIEQQHDLVQEHTHATVRTAALRYGRSL